jgi:hypothetical protein
MTGPQFPAKRMDWTTEAMVRVFDEYHLAQRALKWMLEHRVYWDRRNSRLLEPANLGGNAPLAEPPIEVLAYIHGLARQSEIEGRLGAEYAD